MVYIEAMEEVGSIIGVTKERIRQIEVKALRKLRRPISSKKLIDFLVDSETQKYGR